MSRLLRSSRWSFARLALLVSLACFAFGVAPASAQSPAPAYSPGEVIIKFAPTASSADIQSVRSDLGATQLTSLSWIGASRERIVRYSVDAAVARYRGDSRIAFIEPNYIIRLDRTPNDARFSQLWGMQNTGQTGGTPGADIRATNAWDITTGSSSVLVAIIDTGMDYTHPDLAANVWTNSGEIPGNGIDDDGNGYVDDVHGYDFANMDGDPMDDHSHGTHVSGTIGAVGDNGIGVVGVSWTVKLMALKFLDAGGSGYTSNAILAVQYATQMGVRIMSNSWGGVEYSEALRLAIQAASDAGILFVAAAGNVQNNNNDLFPHYPSSYDAPLVVSVASTDHNDLLSWFSCYGPTSVDLAAPGSDILSTTPGNTYSTYSGTSMATPHVSGALALMLARYPGMSGADAKLKLLATVDPLPSLAGLILTGGRLNAFTMLAEPDSLPPAAIGDLSVAAVNGDWVTLAWTATGDDGTEGRASRYDLRYSTSPITAENFAAATPAPGPANPQPAGSPETVQVSGLAFSTDYWFAIKAFDEYSNPSPVSNIATGTTLPAPDIAVTPGSLSADLFTGEQTTRTLGIFNSGASDLSFQVATTEHATVAVTPAGQPVLAVGHPVPLDQIAGTGIRTEVQLGTGSVLDRDVVARPGPQAPPPLRVMGTEVFGSMQNAYFSGPRTRGNIFHCTTASRLDEHRLYLDPSAQTQLWFLVYEGLAQVGSYQLISASNTSPAGPGAGWYSSGPVDVQLEAGRYYLIVASFEQPCGYYNQTDVSPYPFQASFGELIAGAGWNWAPTSVFPPESAQQVPTEAFGSPVAYYQTLVTRPGGHWLAAAPTEGVVPAGSGADVTVTFDATGALGGDYDGDVVVTSNDPDESSVGIPAHLHVTGAPDIALSDLSFAFGELFIGAVRTDTLLVRNEGTDLLDVTSLSTDQPVFSVEPASFQLAPGVSQPVLVHFAPTTPGPFTGTLTILSNDPDEATLALPLSGTGLEPPDIVVTPDSLSADLLTGEQTTRTVNIANTGLSNLSYQVLIGEAGTLPVGVRISRRFASADPGAELRDNAGGTRRYDAGASPMRPPLMPAFQSGSRVASVAASGAALRILMVNSGGDDSEIRGLLAALPDVAVVDEFNAYTGAPALDLLRQYHAAIVITSMAPADPVGIGNVLADYADGGGGVVLTVASFISGWNISGRLLTEGYFPFTLGSGPVAGSTLGSYDPAHPIMSGVTTLWGDLLGQTAPAPGAQLVASYVSGLPLVATQGHRVVGINLFLAGSGYWTGDVPTLLRNAARWSGGAKWLSAAPTQGIVPPGGSVDVTATFDATGVMGGDYDAAVVVNSNDPDESSVGVPAHLRVTGAPDIALSDLSFAFGELFIGAVRTDTLLVRNEGTDLLDVTSLSTDVPVFSVEPASFQLAPDQSQIVLVRFAPTTPGPFTGTLTILSNDPDEATLALPLSGTGLVPPDIAVTPDSLSADLLTGEQTTRTVNIANTGGSDLDFTVGATVRALSVPVYPELKLGKGELDPRPGILGKGGPDVFGYTWRDSDEPGGPAFSWVDITGIGSPLALSGDDYTVTGVPIGFSFPFYGNTFNTVNVSTNGFLSFTSSSAQWSNYPLPSPYAPENLLAVLWNDLIVTQGSVYAYYDASRFIVSYIGVPNLGGGPPQTFQVILYPSGRIVYQYLTCPGTWDSDATVGIQNATGSDGLTVECNMAYLHDNLAVELGAVPRFLTVVPEAGTILAGGSLDLTATFDATGLFGGDYRADLVVTSNDPDEDSVSVPAHLHVTGAPDIALSELSFAFGDLFIGAVRTDTLLVRNEGTDLLDVTSLSTDLPVFTVEPVSFQLAPGVGQIVLVHFAPTTPGPFTGTLTILSNDQDEATLALPLSGTGLVSPDIVVTPDSLAFELVTGDTATTTLTIYNNGGSPLTFDIADGEALTGPSAATVHGADVQYSKGDPVANRAPQAPADNPPLSLVVKRERATGVGAVLVIADGGTEADVSSVLTGAGYFVTQTVDDGLWDGTNPSPQGFGAVVLLDGVGFGSDMPVGGQQALMNYVSQGGGLILSEWISWEVGNGRYASMRPLIPMTGTGGSVGLLTYNVTQSHPVTNGVSLSFQVASGHSTGYVNSGTAVVTDPSGSAMVVVKDLGAGHIVHFSSAGNYESYHPFAVPDMQRLLVNAADWVSGSQWLSATPRSGTVAAGANLAVTVGANATGLTEGTYRSGLSIRSNDPDQPEVNVSVHLHVLGEPGIGVTPDSLTAELFNGQQITRTLTIANSGETDLSYEISVRATGALAASARISQIFTPAVTGAGLQAAAAADQLASVPPFTATAKPLRTPLSSALPRRDLSSTAGAGLRILMVNVSGDDSEIRGQLAAMPGVAVVDEFDGTYSVPPLGLLRQYGTAILIVGGTLTDPVGLGNVLADYADQGGGVVLTVASFSSGYEVQGRLLTGGYVPFTISSNYVSGGTLGAFDPAHPIMRDVAAVSSSVVAACALAPGAQLVASFEDGTPLVATRVGHVVGVNLYFGDSGYWTGNVPELMHNAAAWANGPQWVWAAPRQGIVPAGGSVEVTATFDATGLLVGDYRADLAINSNDSNHSTVLVPTHLHIADPPLAVDELTPVVSFALHGLKTNPTMRDIIVAFSLPDARSATLELIDISGRRVVEQEVGSLGPGRHAVTLGGGMSRAPGVYLVRLRRAGQSFTVRAVVIR